jgi:ferrochelatase
MATRAVLLANLGSPDSPAVRDVRAYLNEFLMDERVIDIPPFWRSVLVKCIIVPFRAPKSAAKYQTIWNGQGFPLIAISQQVQSLLKRAAAMPVELCMRYGNPTPAAALARLHAENPDLQEVTLVPLYPHYAMSSYETAVEHVRAAHRRGNYPFQLKIVPPFYDNPHYIAALAATIRPFIEEKKFDHVLFSYHGIPVRHVLKTDPTRSHCFSCQNCCGTPSPAHAVCYRHQVQVTTEKVANALGLPDGQFSLSYQSRLGTDAWLQPYTAAQLKKFPAQGIKKLLVVCPAFVSDCLETLEEIQVEGKEEFLEAGGEAYAVVPCLNDRPEWIQTLMHLLEAPATGAPA